ncbi:MAG: PEGA domain-containing protein [Myxococcales bacterium]|nr:PEGA domain-containing protein [Myxococcales bacterium]
MRLFFVGFLIGALSIVGFGQVRAETVRELNRQMTKSFAKSDYRAVIRVALQLYGRTGRIQLLANIGRCFDLLGEDESALRYYQSYLKKEKQARYRRPVLSRIIEIRARLSLRKQEVTLVSDPTGAKVWINGATRPGWVTPFSRWLPVGRTTIRFEKAGYRSARRVITLKPGPPLTLDQRLEPLAPPLGGLVIEGRVERCTVWLNGTKRGVAPLRLEKLPAGRYRLRLQRPGGPVWRRDVTIEAGRTRTIVVDYTRLAGSLSPLPTPTPKRRDPYRIGAWVGLGVGLALLATGTGLQIAAKRADNDAIRYLESEQKLVGKGVVSLEVEAEYNRRYQRGVVRQRWAIGMFVAGGVVAATGIVLFFIKPKRSGDRVGFRVTPIVSPRGYGLSTGWVFD